MARSRLIGSIGGLGALLAPGPVLAHATNTGFGPFYDGIAHFFVTPEDLLTAVAITLLAAMQGTRTARLVVAALPGVWLAGMAAGSAASSPIALSWPGLVLMIALGVVVAADRRLPERVILGTVVLAGLLHGHANGASGAEARLGALFVAGVVAAVFVVATIVGGQVASLRAAWARTAVRVAGSWIAAIGLLMLGWTLRSGA